MILEVKLAVDNNGVASVKYRLKLQIKRFDDDAGGRNEPAYGLSIGSSH